METLRIHVAEVITVTDIVVDAVDYIVRAIINFVKPKPKKAKTEDVPKEDDNKSPPDLGISIEEKIKVTERIS